jgi:WD40 repeat protein
MVTLIVLVALLFIHLESTLVQLALTRLGDRGTSILERNCYSKRPGHSRSVYGVSFHPDGSLAASCGLDAYARVWDLRSGRLFFTYMGHVKPVGYFFFLLHHGTLEVPSQNFVWGYTYGVVEL